MGNWADTIIGCHTVVTDQVSHMTRMKTRRYFVWQEDGADDMLADNRHIARAVTGTTDLFTPQEFDPWAAAFEAALDAAEGVSWYLNSIQYEEDTGIYHYEWVWSVM